MDEEEIEEEYWRCKESPLYFIEKYIQVKHKELKEWVPFRLNKIQLKVYKAIKDRFFRPFRTFRGKVYWRFQYVRLLIVKYRQVGISTLIIALILHDNLFWSGTESAIFLHKEEYSKKMLLRLKEMLELLPAWMKPQAVQDDLDSRSELSFKTIHSRISVGTPGKSAEHSGDKGRSETYQNVMISEMPRYPFQADFLQGITAAAMHGNIYNESTPLKMGDTFQTIFQDARNKLNQWLALFFPWFIDPVNRREFESDEEKQQLKESLTPEEKELMRLNADDVNLESINWRRFTIINDYMGVERRFKQEYPEDEISAFSANGFNYFEDPEFEIKLVTTRFTDSAGRPVNRRDAIKGHFHVIGVDVAKGLGGSHDYSVISVFDVDTHEQVYEWRENTVSDKTLPFKIYEIWRKYPGVVAIENNEYGHGVISACRVDSSFRDDKVFQWMLYSTSKTVDGWRTGSNKAAMASHFYVAIKEAVRVYVQDDSEPLVPVGFRICSPFLVKEMGVFVDDGGTLGAEAESGNHDDCVIAAMIAWQMVPFAASFRKKYLQLLKETMKDQGQSDESSNRYPGYAERYEEVRA